jgi:hypothetical protein
MSGSAPPVANPCLRQCAWRRDPSDDGSPGPARFTCAGCASQWWPGLGWTPAQADGQVPAAVRRALAEPVTSEPGEAPAGSADS